MKLKPELGTFEWWISGLILDQLFFVFSKLNNACSSLVANLQINNQSELRIFNSKVFTSEVRTFKSQDFSSLWYALCRPTDEPISLKFPVVVIPCRDNFN